MTDLQSLHRALSEAESGSRELDAMIAHVIGGYDREVIEAFVGGFEVTSGASLLRYTTDLNAITSLVERKLPGWAILVSWRDGYAVCDIHTHALGDPEGHWPAHESAPKPALALAKAFVSALIAQESEK